MTLIKSETRFLGCMQKMFSRHSLLSFVILSILILLTGCVNDKTEVNTTNESAFFYVTLSPMTRLDSDPIQSDDKEILLDKDKLSVLVFKHEGDNQVFLNKASLVDVLYNAEKKLYNLKLKVFDETPAKISLVVLANFEKIDEISSFKGRLKKDVLSSFTVSNTTDNGDYKWTQAVDNIAFPMWGETMAFTFNKTTTQLKDPIQLMRSVARLDFGFNYHVNELGEEKTEILVDANGKAYSLASLYVYNALQSMKVVPDPHFVNADFTVNKPTLPLQNSQLNPIQIPMNDMIQTTLKKRVYLSENAGGSFDSDKDKVTSFVFGLYNESFKNQVNNIETNVRYFRADLAESGVDNLLPILRNNRYIISIEDIRGTGYETPDEAHQRKATVLVSVGVKEWESSNYDTSIGEVGYERISFGSKRDLQFSAEAEDLVVLPFTSNVPLSEMKLESVNDRFESEILAGTQPNSYELRLRTLRPNNEPNLQKSQLDLIVGHMKFPVKTTQLKPNIEPLKIEKMTSHGRFIKDWKIDNPKSNNGKNEYLTVTVSYKNETKNTGKLNQYNIEARSKDCKTVVFKGVLDAFAPTDENRFEVFRTEVKLHAMGTPDQVGDIDYDIYIDKKVVSDFKLVPKVSANSAPVTMTYRAVKVLTVGMPKYAITSGHSSGKMLMESQNFGPFPVSSFKVQKIHIKSVTELKAEMKNYEQFRANYDIVYISYKIDTGGAEIYNNLSRFILDGGFVVETSQRGENKMKLMDVVCNSTLVNGKFTDVSVIRKMYVRNTNFIKLLNIPDPLFKGSIPDYNIMDTFLRVDSQNSDYILDVPKNATVLGYLCNGKTPNILVSNGKNAIALLRHKTLGYVWCGDSGITSSDYSKGVVYTYNNRPQRHQYGSGGNARTTFNAAFLYNMFEELIKHVHVNKEVDNMYFYGT